MIELHKTVKRIPSIHIGDDGCKAAGAIKGEVVYIHPKGRFYVVRFTYGSRSFCESYLGGWAQYEQV